MKSKITKFFSFWLLGAVLTVTAQAIPLPTQGDAMAATVARNCSGLAERGAGSCRLLGLMRDAVSSDIAHYRWEIRVGPGEHDRIAVHRVVRERAPFRPIRTEQAVMMTHGGGAGFEETFLFGAQTPFLPPEHSLAAFLAADGFDVWGVDFRWILVPADTADVSFVADFDLPQSIGDLGRATRLARLVRWVFDGSRARLHLLGYSRGAQIALAYLNEESQRPAHRRQARGLVSLDSPLLKTDNTAQREAACDFVEAVEQAIANGDVARDNRPLLEAATLAETMPDGPSALAPGLTNRQFALLFGIQAGPQTGNHIAAGELDAQGLPIGLLYTQEEAFFDFFQGISPFDSWPVRRDLSKTVCDQVDVPFDDHLGAVTVPVFFLGAGGGFQDIGLAAINLLGSTDVEVEIVRLLPPEDRVLDIGHVDVLLADDVETLIWEPIRSWLARH